MWLSSSRTTRSVTLWLALSSTLWLSSHAFVVTTPAKSSIASSSTRINTILNSHRETTDTAHFLLLDFALYNGQVVDPYETLQVDRQANAATIKKAYHRLCRICHPDAIRHASLLPDNATREQWERITWSYKLLSDPRQRRKYDVHYAVAYPGETVRRAATAFLWMSLTVLSDVGRVAATKMMEQQQELMSTWIKYPAEQTVYYKKPSSSFFQALAQGFTRFFTQGISRFYQQVVASIMGLHFTTTTKQQEPPKSTKGTASQSSPLFLDASPSEPRSRADGCQPFQVAMQDEFTKMFGGIKLW